MTISSIFGVFSPENNGQDSSTLTRPSLGPSRKIHRQSFAYVSIVVHDQEAIATSKPISIMI